MNIPVNFLIRPGTSRRGAAAGIYSTITACRITSRCAAHRRLGARPLWITNMSRSLTERSANAAKLEAPLPPEFPAAFQRLVDARNLNAEGDRKLVYARNLYEGANGGRWSCS